MVTLAVLTTGKKYKLESPSYLLSQLVIESSQVSFIYLAYSIPDLNGSGVAS